MRLIEVKNTDVWKELMRHPKFEEEFNNAIRNSAYFTDLGNLNFEVSDKKIIVSYNSGVKNRDLDCQYRAYKKVEIELDKDNSLLINELSGQLESYYGYSFNETYGGILNTHYSFQTYDDDGIELAYQSYGDRYILDDEEFRDCNYDLKSFVEGEYNPNLMTLKEENGICHPRLVGSESSFLRQVRSRDNLGIVEVSKYSFDRNNQISNSKNEYYFNTFIGSTTHNNPELIHIMRGFPFASITDDQTLKMSDDYRGLGLTDKNYQVIANERFLKELLAEREKHELDTQVFDKYNMMIEKIKKELGNIERTM